MQAAGSRFDSGRVHFRVASSSGRAPRSQCGGGEFESRAIHGLIVQWEDTALAVRESGFDSPSVHFKFGSVLLGEQAASKTAREGSNPSWPAEGAWQWCLTGPENRRDAMSVRSSILPPSSNGPVDYWLGWRPLTAQERDRYSPGSRTVRIV